MKSLPKPSQSWSCKVHRMIKPSPGCQVQVKPQLPAGKSSKPHLVNHLLLATLHLCPQLGTDSKWLNPKQSENLLPYPLSLSLLTLSRNLFVGSFIPMAIDTAINGCPFWPRWQLLPCVSSLWSGASYSAPPWCCETKGVKKIAQRLLSYPKSIIKPLKEEKQTWNIWNQLMQRISIRVWCHSFLHTQPAARQDTFRQYDPSCQRAAASIQVPLQMNIEPVNRCCNHLQSKILGPHWVEPPSHQRYDRHRAQGLNHPTCHDTLDDHWSPVQLEAAPLHVTFFFAAHPHMANREMHRGAILIKLLRKRRPRVLKGLV